MKLFRTTNSFYDESLLSFLQEYQAEKNSEMNVEGVLFLLVVRIRLTPLQDYFMRLKCARHSHGSR